MHSAFFQPFVRRAVAVAALVGCSLAVTSAADWPEWRGPSRDGHSAETNLPARWSPQGENLAWRIPIGSRSAPVAFGDRIYINSPTPGAPSMTQERLIAIDAETGKVAWERRFNLFLSDVPQHRASWASPAVDPETGNIYLFTVAAQLVCVSPDGKVLWDRSLTDEYGAAVVGFEADVGSRGAREIVSPGTGSAGRRVASISGWLARSARMLGGAMPTGWSTSRAGAVLAVVADDLGDVVLRLGVRRDAAVAHDGAFAGVVGGNGEREITVEGVGEHAQVAHPTEDVLPRIEDVSHEHALGGLWDHLHEAARVGGRHSAWIEVALHADHGPDQRFGDLIKRGRFADPVIVARVALGRGVSG